MLAQLQLEGKHIFQDDESVRVGWSGKELINDINGMKILKSSWSVMQERDWFIKGHTLLIAAAADLCRKGPSCSTRKQELEQHVEKGVLVVTLSFVSVTAFS